jgi:AraC-like DNA-binding protein
MTAVHTFETCDFEQARFSLLSRNPSIQDLVAPANEPFPYKVESASFGRVGVASGSTKPFSMSCKSSDDWYLLAVNSGSVLARFPGGELTLHTGMRSWSFLMDHWLDFQTDATSLSVRIPVEAVIEAVETLGYPGIVSRDTFVTGPAGTIARCGITTLSQQAMRSIGPDVAKPIASRMCELYEDLFLFHAAELVVTSEETRLRDDDQRKVMRAIGFMEENLCRGIGPLQISRAAGMSVRALQYGFKKAYGMSPSRYLKDMRLTRAQSLLSSGQATVTEVVFSCGFNHLGEFSNDYRTRFGERPSETARRRETATRPAARSNGRFIAADNARSSYAAV